MAEPTAKELQAENKILRNLLLACNTIFNALSYKKQTAYIRSEIKLALKGGKRYGKRYRNP